jgi:hypothetical protein
MAIMKFTKNRLNTLKTTINTCLKERNKTFDDIKGYTGKINNLVGECKAEMCWEGAYLAGKPEGVTRQIGLCVMLLKRDGLFKFSVATDINDHVYYKRSVDAVNAWLDRVL